MLQRMLALLPLGVAVGCTLPTMTRSELFELSAGVVHPVTDDGADADGVALRVVAGTGARGEDHGVEVHLGLRSAGDTMELGYGLGRYAVGELGPLGAFLYLGVNLLEWDRVGTDDGAGLGGTTFAVGVGPSRGNGPCLVASTSYDLRFNDPDDLFVGASLGWCVIERSRRIRR